MNAMYLNEVRNSSTEDSDIVYMIIGVADASENCVPVVPEQKSIVGVATTLEEAKKMVGIDYLDVVSRSDINPIFNTVHAMAFIEGQEPAPGTVGYCMVGYSWYIIPMNKNEVVNYTL